MVQKLDKKALALRLFGKDTEEHVQSVKDEENAEKEIESEER